MKKLFSALLAGVLTAASVFSVSAASPHGGGLYVFDSSDSEYWAADLSMLDKTAPALWLEDGNAGGYNDPSYTDATGSVLMETLEPGWYEVVLCNLGTNPEWFPEDVAGKVALVIRGDSTFTVKSQNAADAGAIACLVGNNNRAAEAVDEEGNVSSGTYENVSMSVEYYTIPMCSLGSDFSARLLAQTAGVSIADAVKAVDEVQAGALELSLIHKQSAWVFIGNEEQYKANTTRTDANTKTGAGVTPVAVGSAPAAEAVEEGPTLQNLCLGATVEYSGVEAAGYEGEFAVDGDLATRWASDYVDEAYIIVDIGQPLPIGYVELTWETACAQDYTIETSSDGTSWDVRATVTGNTAGTSPASDAGVVVHEWTPATARFIKINCTKRNTTYGNSLWEIVARKAADTLEATAPAAYPASGTEIPDGSVLINGARIGLEEGWGGNAAAGRDAAFDGDVNTFFDPLGTGDGWAGIDAGEEMILTKIIIHPRDAWAARFNGGTIEGANEEDFSDAVALFLSVEEAGEVTFLDVSDEIEEADNTGYRYFRYINYTTHGDVAEVELYGKAVDGSNPTYGAAEAPAAEAATEEAPAAATEVIAIEAVAQDYPSMDLVANNGASYATLEEAAASLGKTPITGYT
ncbi:MAG: discoidin domain-containing protein, partial [Clostridia bacterium]|nr:discoidin domain-containing protein [Clostridia bacterium]